jgi:hypothetical protein
VPADALPTVTASDGVTATPELSAALVLVPTSSGVAALDGSSGQTTARYDVPAPAKGSQIFPLGNGFLVAGSSTTVYQ